MFAVLRLTRARRLSATTTSIAKPPYPLNSPAIAASSSRLRPQAPQVGRYQARPHQGRHELFSVLQANAPPLLQPPPVHYRPRGRHIPGPQPLPRCQTAFYLRPFKLEPLQGSFVEKQRDVSCTRRAKVAATWQRLARRWQRRKTEVGQEVANAKGDLQVA
ncbi:hypothetical protein NL676_039797 [Syzygium grande]|nr:hypothetical protein NL676_039797 [Syzygium grande]